MAPCPLVTNCAWLAIIKRNRAPGSAIDPAGVTTSSSELVQAEVHNVEKQFLLAIDVVVKSGLCHAGARWQWSLIRSSIVAFAQNDLRRRAINFRRAFVTGNRFLSVFIELSLPGMLRPEIAAPGYQIVSLPTVR